MRVPTSKIEAESKALLILLVPATSPIPPTLTKTSCPYGMDSMRSLNTSLPKSYNNRSAPPEDLLQAFRSAALSVTTLYKSAITDQSNSRQEGYQDALDDLLVFLDNENIGLQDGEGWRIRQWINERYDRTSPSGQQHDTDDETTELEKRPRSSSPIETRSQGEDALVRTRSRSQPLANTESNPETHEDIVSPPMFRFAASQPSQQDMTMHFDTTTTSHSQSELPSHPAPQGPVRVGIVPRVPRSIHRHSGNRHSLRNARDSTINAGAKRKLHFPDFFDISNITFGRDQGSGSAKRGRFA